MNKSKKQLIRLTLLLTSTVAGLVAIPSAHASEPVYNGKPLSEWLLALEEPHVVSGEPVEAPVAEEAVRQIGTNGISTLIDLLGVYDERSAKKVLSKLHNKDLTAWFKFDEDIDSSCKNLRELGLHGFFILGTNAECAVPQITKILYLDESPRALLAVGPKGFSALTNAMSDSNASVRDALIRALGKEGGGDTNAIRQILVNALNDPETLIRLHAADLLRDKAPDAVITTLMPLLDVGDYGQRQSVADALAAYGPAGKSEAPMFLYGNCRSAAETLATLGPIAKIAAPKLLSVFTNVVVGTNAFLIKNLTGGLLDALRKIDPETAGKAEEFLVNSGPLNSARDGYTTTLLPNGKELIAGGWISAKVLTITDRCLSKAELLDPATGKWTETGAMNIPRYDHMAVLLQNGKVLVAGGSDDRGHNLISAELYDSATGKWTVTSSMNSPHPSESMALQSNGKVLVYEGGFDAYPVLGHELFDPISGTWTAIPKEQERNRDWRPSPDQQ